MSKLPKGWKKTTLENICKINMGQSPKSVSYNESGIGLPLVQGNADIKNRKVLPRIYTSEITKLCDIGDIIMTVRAPVGAIAKSNYNACIGRGVCSLKQNEDNDFLYHFLVNYEDKWDRLSQGSTFTAVNGNDIKSIEILLPPLREQNKIADILSTVDQKITFVDNQIEETEALKQGLLQKLLTKGIDHNEFKDSEIGKIPVEWEVVSLKDLLTFKNGVNASKEQYGKGYKFINVLDIINNMTIEHECIIGSVDISEEEFLYNEIIYGDIVFQRSSETKEEVGQSNVYIDKSKSCTFGGFVIRGRAIRDYNPIYMNYLLKLKAIRKQITSKSGGSTRYNIGQKGLSEVVIQFPPLEEQKQIAEILSTADEKLETLREKKESFAELKKGLMQKLLTGEVRI